MHSGQIQLCRCLGELFVKLPLCIEVVSMKISQILLFAVLTTGQTIRQKDV